MNILQINNYHYIRGGIERYYFQLSKVLQEMGHNIIFFSVKDPEAVNNKYINYFVDTLSFDKEQSIIKKIKAACRMLYSFKNMSKIQKLINDYKIDIAHAHSIYHRVCPSVLVSLKRKNIPVVMTLHDYKLECPNYLLYRDGKVCLDCLVKSPFSIIRYRCTKNTLSFSIFHFVERWLHSFLKLYSNHVDFFICPSKFTLNLHAKYGLPKNKLIYIPHFIDTEEFTPNYDVGDYILYVGRLTHEKGLLTLFKAMKGLDIMLKVVGTGPMWDVCKKYLADNAIKNVEMIGFVSPENLNEIYQKAAFLIVPSEWYEVFGLIILEAYASGKPVIGSNIGAISELIQDGETGLLYTPADADDLKEKIRYLIFNPELIIRMGRNGRRIVEQEYNINKHYLRLREVYYRAINSHKKI